MDHETYYYCDASIDALMRCTGVAVVVRDGGGRILDAASCCLEGMTNNEAEYEALILGIELALSRAEAAERVALLTDSQIVVGQMARQFAVRDRKLAPRHEQASRLLAQLPGATLMFIPRERNWLADALATEAMETGLEKDLPGFGNLAGLGGEDDAV